MILSFLDSLICEIYLNKNIGNSFSKAYICPFYKNKLLINLKNNAE